MTMPTRAPETLLVCNCQRTMEIDGAALATALTRDSPLVVASELCQGQIKDFETALRRAGVSVDSKTVVRVACTQEAQTFRDTAEAMGFDPERLAFTNIRERAGWSDAKAKSLPKMAALLAASAVSADPTGTTTLASNGLCLVYGQGQTAIDFAEQLAQRLSVTLLLADVGDALPPVKSKIAIAKGRIQTVNGHLGAFDILVDGYAAALPSSRGALTFAMARNGAKSQCDLIVDISGGPALFPISARRDGYLRADPHDRASLAELSFTAADFVGEFEKPIYVKLDPGLCAHSRSGKVGCRNCLDVCPTGAIAPVDDHVDVDAALCAGCGTCAAVCPTGAVAYAYPSATDALQRIDVLLSTYLSAGGTRPILLIHDEVHGTGLIAALARHGAGLPAHVLPIAAHAPTEVGHDVVAAALALGADHVVLLGAARHVHDMDALDGQVNLIDAILTGLGYASPGDESGRFHRFSTDDPDALAAMLDALAEPAKPIPRAPFALRGSKRDLARVALGKLAIHAPTPQETIPLPKGAPYGRIAIRTEGCTLCLACVGSCPANALSDHPERPQVAFTEAACVQCGVCVATCPENVITLEPRYDFTPRAMTPEVLHKEEPFACIECGKAFGTKATITRVVEKLEGKHGMFKNPAQVRLIQMCDTCRIVTLSNDGNDPYRVGNRPKIRRTEDYIAEAEAERAAKKPPTSDDFLN